MTLHYWITLAKLLALSCGQTAITVPLWQQMRQLEAARLQRLAQRPT